MDLCSLALRIKRLSKAETMEGRGARAEGAGGVPEIVPPAEFPAQFVVQASPHLSEPAAAQVAAQTVLVPVLIDGFEEIAVPDALLAPATCQQRRGNLEDFIHRLPGGRRESLGEGKKIHKMGPARTGIASSFFTPADLSNFDTRGSRTSLFFCFFFFKKEQLKI